MSDFDTYVTGLQQAYYQLLARNRELEAKLSAQVSTQPTQTQTQSKRSRRAPEQLEVHLSTGEHTDLSLSQPVNLELPDPNGLKVTLKSEGKLDPTEDTVQGPQPDLVSSHAPTNVSTQEPAHVPTQEPNQEPTQELPELEEDNGSLMSVELYPSELKHGKYLFDPVTGDYYNYSTENQISEGPVGHLKKITVKDVLYYQDNRDDHFYEVKDNDDVGALRGQIQLKNGKRRAFFL